MSGTPFAGLNPNRCGHADRAFGVALRLPHGASR
jgi:hypothetical protein